MTRNFSIIATVLLTACGSDILVTQQEGEGFVPDEPSLTDTAVEDFEDDDTDPDDDTVETDPDDDTGDTDPDDDTGETDPDDEVVLAEADADTFDDPLFYESFVGSGAPDEFTVADDVSVAPGDVQDWVAFTTPALRNDEVDVTFVPECAGTQDLSGRLWDDGTGGPFELGASDRVDCGEEVEIRLETNHDYLVRLYYPYETDADAYTAWTLHVSW